MDTGSVYREKTIVIKSQNPKWFGKELCIIKKKLRSTKREEFKKLKCKYINECRKAKKKYINDVISRNYSKDIWAVVQKGKSQLKEIKTDDEKTIISDPDEIVKHLFNAYKDKEVMNTESENEVNLETNIDATSWKFQSVSPAQVTNIIKTKIKPNKASGPDEISPNFVLKCVNLLAQPIAQLFNKAIEVNKFPRCLNEGKIVPVPKTLSTKSLWIQRKYLD